MHHLLSHDGPQLADFNVSPVRSTHVDINALSLLRRQHSNISNQVPSHCIYIKMKPPICAGSGRVNLGANQAKPSVLPGSV